jgi:hypothetical protein
MATGFKQNKGSSNQIMAQNQTVETKQVLLAAKIADAKRNDCAALSDLLPNNGP